VPVVHLQDLTFGEFLLWVLLGAALSMWVYWHASGHRSRHPYAWGIAAFLLLWIGVAAYFAHYYSSRRRR
jgi:thiol:disulfide interchange protein